MKQSQQDILTEARLLLPWYSQGLLDQEQMDWMKIQINNYPQLLEEQLAVQKEANCLQKQINSLDIEKYSNHPQRLDNLLEKIHQYEQSTTTPLTVTKTPAYKYYINKIKYFLFPTPEIGLWKAGASLALLVISVQSGLLVHNHLSNTNIQYDTLSGENTIVESEENILLVSFQEKATMQQVHAVLIKHQLNFIQGPDPAGLYLIRIPNNMDQATLIKILESEHHIIRFIDKP